MNKAYILDFNILVEHNLTIEEFTTLLHLNDKSIEVLSLNDDIINSLQEKQFIKIIKDEDEEIHIIREKSRLLIEFLTIEGLDTTNKQVKVVKRSSRAINNDLDEFIEDFRLLWKGLKPGSMGSPIACRSKMERWMRENPKYTKEDVLRASKVYISSLNNYQYLQQADYFIYKKDAHGESSRLSAFIDESDIQTEGWSSQLN